jgi:hypothetical protein
MEQRYRAVLEVEAGVPVTEVAERFGWYVSDPVVVAILAHRDPRAIMCLNPRRVSHAMLARDRGLKDCCGQPGSVPAATQILSQRRRRGGRGGTGPPMSL